MSYPQTTTRVVPCAPVVRSLTGLVRRACACGARAKIEGRDSVALLCTKYNSAIVGQTPETIDLAHGVLTGRLFSEHQPWIHWHTAFFSGEHPPLQPNGLETRP